MKFLRALPLILTIFRLPIGPAFLWVSYRVDGKLKVPILIVLVLLGILTDWLDGKLARRWQAVTITGKLLDPFADALFCMIIFVDFALKGQLWPWLVGLLIAREALVTFVLRPVALSRGIVVAAAMPGKIKTAIQFVVIFTVLVKMLVLDWPPLDVLAPYLGYLVTVGAVAMLGFSWYSGTKYAVDIWRAIKSGRAGGNPAHSGKDENANGPASGRPQGGN